MSKTVMRYNENRKEIYVDASAGLETGFGNLEAQVGTWHVKNYIEKYR